MKRLWRRKRDDAVFRGDSTSAAHGPAHDLDAVDALGPEYRSSKLAWDLDDRAPWPSRYVHIRRVNGPIDLDDPPPVASGADAERAEPKHPARRPQPNKKQTLQSNRPDPNPRRSARSWLTWVAGGLVFAVSFIIAMGLTKPPRPPTPAMTMLAAATISDLGRLMAAVKAAGLRGTPDVKGNIDEIIRLDNDHVTLKGWATDISESDSPLAVMAFVDGRNKLTIETDGRRPDITAALGLSDAASANVSFEGNLVCSRGQKLIVVAVARSGVYGQFRSRLCP
jgi:hypothetical protein